LSVYEKAGNTMKKEIVLSWSFCHECPAIYEYCKPMIEEAARHGIQRLELCGVTQSDIGNADAYVHFKSHPIIAQTRDENLINSNIENLRQICRRAHELGMEVDMWHREVNFPKILLETEKGLVNEDGDIDFTGPYLELIEAKISEFFENVPEVDGLVMTPYESLFPIIHVVNKQKNPPERNLHNVMAVFKKVCEKYNKRFVSRTFAATDEDYALINRVILDMNRQSQLYTSMKIVPYDWHPFLPIHPIIKDLRATKRIVELDLMGEYYGQGVVPCCYPEEVQRYIRYLKGEGVEHVVGRVDRMGVRTMDTAADVNVYAMGKLMKDPDADIDGIYNEWATTRWDANTAKAVIPGLKRTFEITKKTFYLDQHLISHERYPDFKMLKWGRSFGYFKEGEPLRRARQEWGIISSRISPTWKEIVADKDKAISLLQSCIDDLERSRRGIKKDAYDYLLDGYKKFMVLAKAFRLFCTMTIAYLKVLNTDGAEMDEFIKEKNAALALAKEIEQSFGKDFFAGMPAILADDAEQITKELEIELAVQRQNKGDKSIVDWVLCGGISFEWAVYKLTHGSWVYRDNDIIYRLAGDKITADGFFEYEMKVPAGDSTLCLLWGDTGEKRQAYLDIDGKRQVIEAGSKKGFDWVRIPIHSDKAKIVPVRVTKKSMLSPMVSQMKVVKN
jgi:hypothetical protein